MSREIAPDVGAGEFPLTDADIYEAMQEIPGYLDITPGSFREIYRLAYRLARQRLFQEVTAARIMTREVVTVRPDTPVAEVAAAMGRTGVSGVPVVDARRRVVGVISERDFLREMGSGEANFMSLVAACLRSKGCVALPIKKKAAADLMSAPAVTVPPETTVREVAEVLAAHRINRVPVVDGDGRLVGIVSRGDLLQALQGGVSP
jgi:CBS-domain-containing membrane protein